MEHSWSAGGADDTPALYNPALPKSLGEQRMRRSLLIALVLAGAPALVFGQRAQRPVPAGLDRLSDEFTDLALRVSQSVVRIEAKGLATGKGPGGTNLVGRSRAMGSGVVVDPEGYVVTNAHVVDGAERLQVFLLATRPAPGSSILRPRSRGVAARVLGMDRETDLAVLKLDGEQGLQALSFGDSETLREGQLVFAFGSPLGLENSVSMGVVSAVARQLRPDDPMIYVQTDASINPGNSGGPLVDSGGRIMGLNTAILSQSGGSEGIGLAVPSNIVRTIYERLRSAKGGRFRRGTIGVRPQSITQALAIALGLPREGSVILGDVAPGSAAEKAGLQVGDVVLALDGKPMENGRQMEVNLYGKAPGTTVNLTILRDGQPKEIPVVVGEKEEDPERFVALVDAEKNLIPRLGVLAMELDDDTRKILPKLRRDDGILVAARVREGTEEDLTPGDVIYAINGVSVRSLSELRTVVERSKRGETLAFQVERKGHLLYLTQEVE
jgi:serine protease Do